MEANWLIYVDCFACVGDRHKVNKFSSLVCVIEVDELIMDTKLVWGICNLIELEL